MASFKQHPIFYTALVALGGLAVGQAVFLFNQRGKVAVLDQKIQQAESRLAQLSSARPFPSPDNVAAIETDRIKAEVVRERVRAALTGRDAARIKLLKATPPAESTDAYFDLQNFLEAVRTKAAKGNVEFASTNQFGFAVHASVGPEPGLIPAVYRQRQVAEYLLDTLIDAKPKQIVALQRERPLTQEQAKQLAESIANGTAQIEQSAAVPGVGNDLGDFFVIDPRISSRVPNFLDTSAFRLTFIGYSESLRNLLNQLAQFDLPVVVRAVEVESLVKETTQSRGNRTATPAASPFGGGSPFGPGGQSAVLPGTAPENKQLPLVENTLSRFVVTVEFVTLTDTATPTATP
jgi:hypothetical protein